MTTRTCAVACCALLWAWATGHSVVLAQGDPPPPPRRPAAGGALSADPPPVRNPAANAPAVSAGGAVSAIPVSNLVQTLNQNPELVLDTQGFLTEVSELAFSPDGLLLAVTSDKVCKLFDTRSGELVTTLRGDHSRSAYGSCGGVAFSPDGQHLLVGIYDDHSRGNIRVYRTGNFKEIDSLLPGLSAPCGHLAFSRDGKFLVANDTNGEIVIWDWPQRKKLSAIPARNPDKPIIDTLKFADADPLLVSVEADAPHIYRIPEGRELKANEVPPRLLGWMADILQKKAQWPAGTTVDPRQFDFRLERSLWSAAGFKREGTRTSYWVGLWKAREMNPANGPLAPAAVYAGHRWKITNVALSSDGTLGASGDKFGEVHIWDARTGAPRHRIASEGMPIYEVALDETNQRLAFASAPDIPGWGLNSYGKPAQVLDLSQRAIQDISASGPFAGIQEQVQRGELSVKLQAPVQGEQSFRLQKLSRSQKVSEYRVPSGRNPSVLTLLDGPRLGVGEPVLFGDAEGLLALWDSSGTEMRRYYRGHNSMVTALSPSRNGALFVSGSTDRTIRIWSLLNPKSVGIFDFKYENSAVIEVPPGSSSARAGVQVGDRIVAFDGKSLKDVYELMLYNKFDYAPGQTVPVKLQRGTREINYPMTLVPGFDYVEPVLNVFISGPQRWIMWTPQGYYDCAPGADELIGWHINNGPEKAATFYQAQQFRKQMYRPDIINRIIASGQAEQSIQEANSLLPGGPVAVNLNDRATFQASTPPVVTVGKPGAQSGMAGGSISVQAAVTTTNDKPISAVTLLHNGVRAKVFKPEEGSNGKTMSITEEVKLLPGRNEFTFIAENSVSTSSAREATFTMVAQTAAGKSKVYLLAVGISEYQQAGAGFANLKFAAQDARDFAAACAAQQNGKLYSQVETRVLADKDATRDKVLEGLEWLADSAQPGDLVVLFLSGHSFLDDRQNYYLGTYETDPARLRSTAIGWREFTSLLKEELPGCKRVVLLDVGRGESARPADARNPLLDLSAPEMGAVFLSASTFQQASREREDLKHGAFTQAILDVLADRKFDTAPTPADGLLSFLELDQAVSARVKALTEDRQNPLSHAPGSLKRMNLMEFK